MFTEAFLDLGATGATLDKVPMFWMLGLWVGYFQRKGNSEEEVD